MKESELIKKIIKIFNKTDRNIVIGPGDDCSVLDFGDKRYFYLLTVDEMVENTHFILDFLKPEEVASKLVRMNISDIYSMGKAKPCYCLVSGGLNYEKINDLWVSSFLKSLKKELDRFSIINIGGNLTKSKEIFFSMTLIGKIDKNKIIKRTGAKAGDFLCCIGNCGNSRAAVDIMTSKKRNDLNKIEEKILKSFIKPEIYVSEIRILSDYASAMIDNSDGLFRSAQILAEMNKIKIEMDFNELIKLCDINLVKWAYENKKDPVEYSLFGGEDYNPIFSVPPDKLVILSKKIKNIKVVGKIREGRGLKINGYYGKIKNFEHF